MSKVYYHKKNGIWYVNVMIDGEQYHRSTRQTTRKGAGVWAEEFVQTKMLEALAAKQAALQPPSPPPTIVFRALAERWEAAQDEDGQEIVVGQRRRREHEQREEAAQPDHVLAVAHVTPAWCL